MFTTIAFEQTHEALEGAVWTTVVVLAWLRQKHVDKEDEWKLVAKKAERWLKRQGVNIGETSLSF